MRLKGGAHYRLCDHESVGGRSIQLARVFGIRVGVHPSWFFVLFLIIWFQSRNYGAAFPDDNVAFALATASALLFFASVVLHELGHGVVAVRNGIAIDGIDLWLLGGVAKMGRDAPSPGVEFRVAAAGPLVTAAVALACYAGAAALVGPERVLLAALAVPGTGALASILAYLAVINVMLLVLNLLPGFPLDGGRIVRAIAWWRTGDRSRATRIAALLGRAFSFVLFALGLLLAFEGALVSGLWLAVIGLFLGQSARAAVAQSRVTARIEGLRVADVMDSEPVAVPAEAPLDRALEDFFLRYRWPWFPVVDARGRFLGLLRREQLDGVPEDELARRTVDEVMSADGQDAFRVQADEPLESVLGSEGMRRLGAMLVVDRDGTLRGVVTRNRLSRALRPVAPLA